MILKITFDEFQFAIFVFLKFISMSFNSFGNLLKVTTFGESHGTAIGGIIDGFPAGLEVDFEAIQEELDRRKPGQSKIVTQRKEPDTVEFLSGIFEGKTTGTSIGFIIKNTNQKSHDYNHNTNVYRPSHADFTYDKKFGIRDHKGGGRSSARETANWVVAGALAKQLISSIKINAFTSSVGDIFMEKPYQEIDFSKTESNIVRCPDKASAEKMIEKIKEITEIFKAEGKANLPVAVIENGSSKEENVVVGIVDTIEELIEEKKLSSPALLVFGNVVSLHPQFNSIHQFYAIMAQEEY